MPAIATPISRSSHKSAQPRGHSQVATPMEPQEPSAMATEHQPQQQHFLIVTYPAQGHITPARHLARRLASTCSGARVTICAPLSAFRRMFPSAAVTGEERGDGDGAIAYVAYSDGYDGGFDSAADSYARYMEQARTAGERSLAVVLRRLRGAGRPVTCAVYTLLLPWVAGVAREHGVAATAVFWIQPATALAAYYYYFRGHRENIVAAAASGDPGAEVRLPGLPPLRVRDLPSFLAITAEDNPFAFVLPEFRELIDAVERGGSSSRPPTYVLANTFDAMEHDALASLRPHVDVFAVGPVLSFLHEADDAKRALSPPRDVFDHDKNGYLNWLDSKPSKSVVYISFGSSSVMSKKQVAEITDAMAQIKKPFLWVLRKDNCNDKDDDAAIKKLAAAAATENEGVVVEWCDQARVLSYPSVACFVTHGGWSSTLESAARGVPLVVAPQYSDQGTSAWLLERMGIGIRAAAREADGVVEAAELRRCVEAATSEAVASRAAAWEEEARAAVDDGGGSERSLRDFLRQIADDGN